MGQTVGPGVVDAVQQGSRALVTLGPAITDVKAGLAAKGKVSGPKQW